jgi:hypothetical protein
MSKAKLEPGEGSRFRIGEKPPPALNASHFGHPLPQGERVTNPPRLPDYPFNLAIATPSRAN